MKQPLTYLALLLSTFIYGQNTEYYKEIYDATGFETRLNYQDSLNATAKRLVAVFTDYPTVQNQFKVLSANFYKHNEAQKGGIPAVMEQLNSLAKRTAPYYVLIGKESNEFGIFQRFWVKLELPAAAEFPCFDATRKSMIEAMAMQEMNRIHAENQKAPYLFAEAEQAGINTIKGFLKKFTDCCAAPNARFSPACTCVGIDTITTALVQRGMLYFDVEDVTVTDQSYATIDATKNITITNNGYPWALTDDLTILADKLDAAKDSIKVRYFDDLSCFFIWDYLNGKDDLPTASLRNTTSDFFHEVIVLNKDGKKRVFFRFSEEARGEILDKWTMKTVSMMKPNGLYYLGANLFFEKCFRDKETYQEARNSSPISSFALLRQAIEKDDKTYGIIIDDIEVIREVSKDINYKRFEQIDFEKLMVVYENAGFIKQLIRLNTDITFRLALPVGQSLGYEISETIKQSKICLSGEEDSEEIASIDFHGLTSDIRKWNEEFYGKEVIFNPDDYLYAPYRYTYTGVEKFLIVDYRKDILHKGRKITVNGTIGNAKGQIIIEGGDVTTNQLPLKIDILRKTVRWSHRVLYVDGPHKGETAIETYFDNLEDYIGYLEYVGFTNPRNHIIQANKDYYLTLFLDALNLIRQDCNSIDWLLEKMPSEIMSGLPLDSKVQYLRTLLGCHVTEGGFLALGANEELAVLNILGSITASEAANFITAIKKDYPIIYRSTTINKPLYEQLLYKMDDFSIRIGSKSEANYAKAVDALSRIVNLIHPIDSEVTAANLEREPLVWSSNNHWLESDFKGMIEYTEVFHADSRIKYEIKTCKEIRVVEQAIYGQSLPRTKVDCKENNPTELMEFDYFKPVTITFLVPPKNLADGKKLENKTINTYFGFIDYLLTKQATQQTEDVTSTLVNVAAFGLGVGQLRLAIQTGNVFRGILGVVDIGSTAADQYINSYYLEQFLLEEYTEEETTQMIAELNKYNLAAQLFLISTSAYDLWRFTKGKNILRFAEYQNIQRWVDTKKPSEEVLKLLDSWRVNGDNRLVTLNGDLVNVVFFDNFGRNNINAWNVVYDSGGHSILRVNEGILSSISELIEHNLFNNIGSASKSNIGNINRYTVKGNYLNDPMRGFHTDNPLYLPNLELLDFEYQSYLSIVEGLKKLRLTNRLETDFVYRGRTVSQFDYNVLFGLNSPQDIPLKGFQSATKDIKVAKHFVALTNFPGDKVRVIMKIKSKNGIYIDDFSDWGSILGPLNHGNDPPVIQIQQEVLMEEGYFRKLGEPQPYIENGTPKVDIDENGNEIPWIIIELEEIGTPIRQISN